MADGRIQPAQVGKDSASHVHTVHNGYGMGFETACNALINNQVKFHSRLILLVLVLRLCSHVIRPTDVGLGLPIGLSVVQSCR